MLGVAGIPPSPKYKRRRGETKPGPKSPGRGKGGLLGSWVLRAAACFPSPGPVGTPPRFPRSPHLANDAPRRSGSATDLPCSVRGFMLVPCISYLPLLTPQIPYMWCVRAVLPSRRLYVCLARKVLIPKPFLSPCHTRPSLPPRRKLYVPYQSLPSPPLPGVAP